MFYFFGKVIANSNCCDLCEANVRPLVRLVILRSKHIATSCTDQELCQFHTEPPHCTPHNKQKRPARARSTNLDLRVIMYFRWRPCIQDDQSAAFWWQHSVRASKKSYIRYRRDAWHHWPRRSCSFIKQHDVGPAADRRVRTLMSADVKSPRITATTTVAAAAAATEALGAVSCRMQRPCHSAIGPFV